LIRHYNLTEPLPNGFSATTIGHDKLFTSVGHRLRRHQRSPLVGGNYTAAVEESVQLFLPSRLLPQMDVALAVVVAGKAVAAVVDTLVPVVAVLVLDTPAYTAVAVVLPAAVVGCKMSEAALVDWTNPQIVVGLAANTENTQVAPAAGPARFGKYTPAAVHWVVAVVVLLLLHTIDSSAFQFHIGHFVAAAEALHTADRYCIPEAAAETDHIAFVVAFDLLELPGMAVAAAVD
jgi:hypothetical protein